MTTPTQTERATDLLGQPLAQWITKRRDAGDSWDTIARQLYIDTEHQVDISGEWLRRWHKDTDTTGAGAA